MKRQVPNMRSLFVKIFLFFWVAMTAIGAAFAVIYVSTPPTWVHKRKLFFISQSLHQHGVEAVHRLEGQGRGAAEEWNLRLKERLAVRVHLFQHGKLRLSTGQPGASTRALAEQALRKKRSVHRVVASVDCYAVPLSGPGLGGWVVVGELPQKPRFMQYLRPETLLLRLLVVFLVSGLICYLLARYIAKPLLALRRATQKLAQGDLDARVGPALSRRRDETGELGRDFDRMADRLQALLDAQTRLLRDISHELRSPLARLNVALGLVRQKTSAEAHDALDRMQKDADRLNDLIAQLTTLTRLESGADAIQLEAVDLAALTEEIVRDADFEGQARGREVELSETCPVVIQGSPELLRRALENVVRNGLSFTPESTTVAVALARAPSAEGTLARITVRDHGPGVPEEALPEIFQPFFRVEQDRERRRGGSGIGLAISQRAVRLHGGEIRAENDPEGGLRVVIELPIPPSASS